MTNLPATTTDRTSSFLWHHLDLPNISEKYSTPLYITNRNRILENLSSFVSLLGSSANVLFPVKASPCLAVFQMLAQHGCGADCASAREIELARMAGVPVSRLSYYSPATDVSLAATLLREGGSVVLDSPSKLAELEDLLDHDTVEGKLFLRVNPALTEGYKSEADYQHHTSHGNPTSQFGVSVERAVSLICMSKLSFSGLHVHVGTQMDNLDVFQESLLVLHRLLDEINSVVHHKLDQINLGGGLGIPSQSGDSFPTVAELESVLKCEFREQITYKMEPGTALFGDATALRTRVQNRKTSGDKNWAIVDVGTDQLLKVTLAGFGQQVLRADGTPLPNEGKDSVAGPLCFAGDIILPKTDLSKVTEGDLLLLPNAGAYCRSVSNHFNGRSEPGTLMVEDTEVCGLAYVPEDPFWEPVVQSFKPLEISSAKATKLDGQTYEETFSASQLDKLRSVYIRDECRNDTYELSGFRRISYGNYEMTVEARSSVPFISAPLVMRIISDGTIAVMIDMLGHEEKNVSVWGSRFNVSLDSIVRANRPQSLKIRVLPQMNSTLEKKREYMTYWKLGEGSHGSIHVIV